MKISFKPIPHSDAFTRLQRYYAEFKTGIDTYTEEQILRSNLYEIHADGAVAGLCAILNRTTLTHFSLDKAAWKHSRAIMNEALQLENVCKAEIPTGDGLFMALAADFQKKIELQGYLFMDNGDPGIATPHGFTSGKAGEELKLMESCDKPFHDDLVSAPIPCEVYCFRSGRDVVSFGVIQVSALVPGIACVGMFVLPEHRKKNFGTWTILSMKALVRERGLAPRCGCWYYNNASRFTLQKAGFIPEQKMLVVHF
jgi:hypothetical protein